MAFAIEWSEKASADLDLITGYLVREAGQRIAGKILNRITQRVQILVNNPRGGEREWMLDDQPEEYRRLVEGNYKIVYVIQGEMVYIVAVVDCRRDPAALRESVVKTEA
jgi:plasmid stabilization system protein ParE